jgi:hypothetical protein
VPDDPPEPPLRAVMQQQELDAEGLPPLASLDASDDERGQAIEARMVARYGAPSRPIAPERGPRRKLGCCPWSAVRERQLQGLVVA